MSEESKTPQDVLKWEFVDDSMKQGIKMTTIETKDQLAARIIADKFKQLDRANQRIGDMKELIAAAAEHDDPKRVLREFMAARPELFGERKP